MRGIVGSRAAACRSRARSAASSHQHGAAAQRCRYCLASDLAVENAMSRSQTLTAITFAVAVLAAVLVFVEPPVAQLLDATAPTAVMPVWA